MNILGEVQDIKIHEINTKYGVRFNFMIVINNQEYWLKFLTNDAMPFNFGSTLAFECNEEFNNYTKKNENIINKPTLYIKDNGKDTQIFPAGRLSNKGTTSGRMKSDEIRICQCYNLAVHDAILNKMNNDDAYIRSRVIYYKSLLENLLKDNLSYTKKAEPNDLRSETQAKSEPKGGPITREEAGQHMPDDMFNGGDDIPF